MDQEHDLFQIDYNINEELLCYEQAFETKNTKMLYKYYEYYEPIHKMLVHGIDMETLTPYHYAVICDCVDAVKWLIKVGDTRYDQKDSSGKIPLIYALSNKIHYPEYINMMELLLGYIDDISIYDIIDDFNMLMFVSNSGIYDKINLVLKKNNNISVQNMMKYVPSNSADYAKIFYLFIDYGLDTSLITKNNRTFIHYAAECGQYNMLDYLLRKHPGMIDIQYKNVFTPLLLAIELNEIIIFDKNKNYNAQYIIEKLIEFGSNAINIPDKHGRTPYQFACESLIETTNDEDIIHFITIIKTILAITNDYNTLNKYMFTNKQKEMMQIDDKFISDVRYRVYFAKPLLSRLLFL